MKAPRHDPDTERSHPPMPGRWRRGTVRLGNFHLRDLWWRTLDFLETNRSARMSLYLGATGIVLAGVIGFWAYPWWVKHNAVRIAREWLAAGKLQYAAEAAQHAAAVDPENPEPWLIAAELARRGNQTALALSYVQRAAELAPGNSDILIDWAAAALRADKIEEAARILDQVPAAIQAGSPHVQRLRGEIARQNLQFTAAQAAFETARRIDGPVPVDEVPLGLVLLNAKDPAVRKQGLNLLEKWATDHDWGAAALRALLEDALLRDDLAGLQKWAGALRAHPRCTVADMPRCLLALAKSNDKEYREVLATLEKNHAVTPPAAGQLLSWLNQIGRGADAVGWMQTLPAAAMQRPPLAVIGAEALRQAGEWKSLQAWTTDKDWGPDAEFMRWAYGLEAAFRLGEVAPAALLERSLTSHAEINGVHALFAASLLYSWGRTEEAVGLWWTAADQPGQIAIDALGSLARHYQTQRDAEGQYRVFRQLRLLRPQDAAIGNNFAFFAALTGREPARAEQVARDNLAVDPTNSVYLATCAFVLCQRSRAEDAMTLLKPVAAQADKSPALAFAYGLALAGTGQKTAARKLLAGLPPESLTTREVQLIRAALAD